MIVDSAPYHYAAWQQICRQWARDLTQDQFRETFGQRNAEIIAILSGSVPDEETVCRVSAEKEEIFRRLAAGHITMLPGVGHLLQDLRAAGFAQAIGSSTPRENVDMILSGLNIAEFFSTIVAERDVKAGKPDPEIFLTAASRLNAAPQASLVIEDAVAGVAAAKAARMACVAVTNTRGREDLSEADLVVDSLQKVDAATIGGLIDTALGRAV